MTNYPAPGAPAGAVLVFAHGAGAGQRHPFMTAYARAIAAHGIDVVTFDFPYMAAKRRLPDKPPVLEAAFQQVIAAARDEHPGARIFAGGKSMGGRIATHLAAQPGSGLAGVISLGYPLHPPGKPLQKRIGHFPEIDVPWLIVQGERDAFGRPDELEPDLTAVRSPVTLYVVDGGDHSLAVKGRPAEAVREQVTGVVARWIADLLGP
jgi:predicted alpha/beta-hydrolase family hydrolase